MSGRFFVSDMQPEDWADIRRIYQEGIDTGDATFEVAAPEWEAWDAGHLAHSRLVARENDRVVGWAALSPVSKRVVYRGVAEVSVYVAEAARGRGCGAALLAALVNESERNGVWTLQSSIFPENAGSAKLHGQFGFREVGRRERIAQREGRWRDTVLLERRSRRVGI